MPGLFGVISLRDHPPHETARLERLFNGIARRLTYLPGYRSDLWRNHEAGVLVGRYGLPFHHPHAWQERSRGVSALFAGSEHGGGQAPDATDLGSGAALRRYRGFYATVLHGGQPAVSLIAVDRRASVPVYYAYSRDVLLFASEVKGLLACDEVARELDLGAVANLLVSGHLVSDETLLRDVRRLRGGECLRIENGRVARETYWRFAPGSALDAKASVAELEEELGRLTTAAVGRNLGDPAKTVICLSGGCDSRGVLAGAIDTLGGDGSRLQTVSWGEDRGPGDSDAGIAAALAAEFGFQHRFISREVGRYALDFATVNGYLDGASDIAANHPSQHRVLAPLAEQGIERMLRGDHAFGPFFEPASSAEARALIRLRRVREGSGVLPSFRSEHRAALMDASDASIDAVEAEVQGRHSVDAKDFFFFSHRSQCFLATTGRYKQYRFDHRNPLLDEDLLDFLARVPPALRVEKRLWKQAMARRHPRAWKFPYARFDNVENWAAQIGTATPVQDYVRRELEDRESAIWNYFDPHAVQAAFAEVQRRAAAGPRSRTWTGRLRAFAKSVAGKIVPAPLVRIHSQRRKTQLNYRVTPDNLLQRLLVLKHFQDTIVNSRAIQSAA